MLLKGSLQGSCSLPCGILIFPPKEAKTNSSSNNSGGKPSRKTIRVGILTGKGKPFAEPRSAKKVVEWRVRGVGEGGDRWHGRQDLPR